MINAARAMERCECLAALGPPPAWSRPWKLRRWLAAYRRIMALDISSHAEMLRDVYSSDAVKRAVEANRMRTLLHISRSRPEHEGPWVAPVVSAVDAERPAPPADRSPVYRRITIPADVQASYDALSEDKRAELRTEIDAAVDGLYRRCGITRSKPA